MVLDGLGVCLWGLVSGPPEGLVFPSARVSSPVLPRGFGASLPACFPGGPEGGFLPFLPGVFRSGGECWRSRAR